MNSIGPGMGIRIGQGGKFSPKNRGANLVLWLPGSTITQSGGNVATWPDSSGNWGAATPNGAGPAYTASSATYNHLPVATFTASQQLLVPSFAVSQPNTIYLVCDNSAASANAIDGGSSREIIGDIPNWYMNSGASINSSVSSNGPHVLAAIFDNAGGCALYIDTSAAANVTGSTGVSGMSGGMRIGSSNGPANGITGNIAEILVTNVHDTPSQIKQMFTYLGKKYAQSWS